MAACATFNARSSICPQADGANNIKLYISVSARGREEKAAL